MHKADYYPGYNSRGFFIEVHNIGHIWGYYEKKAGPGVIGRGAVFETGSGK